MGNSSVHDVDPLNLYSTPVSWSEGYSTAYYLTVAIIMIISTIVNSFVILTVIFTPRLQESANIFIASLSTSELIYAVGLTVHSVASGYGLIFGKWPDFSAVVFKILAFMWFFSICSNYSNLLFLSIEIWLFISKPFLHQRVSIPQVVTIGVIIAWMIPVLANVQIITTLDLENELRIRFLYLFPLAHSLWSVILAMIYIHIAAITHRQTKAIERNKIFNETFRLVKLKSIKEKWKTFRLLVTIYGTFLVLNTPFVGCSLYLASVGSKHLLADIPFYAKFLAVIHNCSHFFIYVLQEKRFNAVFKRLYRKLFCCMSMSKVKPMSVSWVSGQSLTRNFNK